MKETTLVSIAAAWLACASLTACTAPPVMETERLDAGTGTTVSLIPKPIELLTEQARGPAADPFAYLAPFETNRMGQHELYLWVSVPSSEAPAAPVVRCDADALDLMPLTSDLGELGVSEPPYRQPAPWSVAYYFRLPRPALECIAKARRLAVSLGSIEAGPQDFVAVAEGFPAVGEFASRSGVN